MDMQTKMATCAKDLKIRPTFPCYNRANTFEHFMKGMKDVLMHFLPDPLPFTDQKSLFNWIESALPNLIWTDCVAPPDCFSLFFLSRPLSSISIETVFTEMIKRFLLTHQEIKLLSSEGMHFCFDFSLKNPLFISELKILVRSQNELSVIQENLPLLKKELIQTLRSGRYANAIVSSKAFSLDLKINLIQEFLVRLLKRFPDEFDHKLFDYLSYIRVMTTSEFREQRTYLHLSRIITSFFLMQKQLDRELKFLPERRHISVRFSRTHLQFPFGKKRIISLIIAVNLFHKYELFEEKHILSSAQKFIFDIRMVPGSFLTYKSRESSILSLYIELEKVDGSLFSQMEVQSLKKKLKVELSKRIECLVPSLFTVRNEEETMRNILILSGELKNLYDIPQMMISFDQHSQNELTFTVVLLRIKKEGDPSIQKLLKHADKRIEFVSDRVQIVSYLENNYPIEANVFRLQISKLSPFLRMDFSVNLYLARQEIVSFLNTKIGEIRDYNGGMIVKQGELLSQFKRLFNDLSKHYQELLENFFYSLNPIEAQSTISLQLLSQFFELFLKQIEKKETCKYCENVIFERDTQVLFAVIVLENFDVCNQIEERFHKIDIDERSLISSKIVFEGSYYLSYLFSFNEKKQESLFKETILRSIKEWKEEKEKLQSLHACFDGIVSLDPRIGGDDTSTPLIRLLFNGLFRLDTEGIPRPSVAKSHTVSKDKKRYVFKLHKTYWSNGSPVIAYDFEYAWKKILSPNFSTPFAYVFYAIKHAKQAKAGEISLNEVGIVAKNDYTLVVDLEHPEPSFIESTAGTLYSPVNHALDQAHPNWASQKNEDFVCNGPFKLKPSRSNYSYELEKNPSFSNQSQVKIDTITITQAHGKTAIEMFLKKQFDFIRMPTHLIRESTYNRLVDFAVSVPSSRVFWFCLNVNCFPFSHHKLRKAFGHALNRERIKEVFPLFKRPALTPLSDIFTHHLEADFLIQEDEEMAKTLFNEALIEMGLKLEDFPVININVPVSAKRKEMAEILKSDWERIFGIHCTVEVYPWQEFFYQLTNGFFQVSGVTWESWLNDPMYTLNAFKYRNEKINFSNWENNDYQKLLKRANQEINFTKRGEFLAAAEEILIKDVVVLPIFYEMSWHIKKSIRPDRELILPQSFSPTASLDLSQAYFKKNGSYST